MEHNNQATKPKINFTEFSCKHFEDPETTTNENGAKKDMYLCKLCNRNVNGTKKSNLSRHLKRHHQEVFNCLDDLGESIEKKRAKLLLECVELVTVNGNTFSHLCDSGLISMLDEKLNELAEAGRAVNLTDPHLNEVKEILSQTAQNVQEKITEEMHNRPLTLMVDITTKNRRSILGVSTQFIMNGKQIRRSIGMLELKQSHTADHLSNVICELLQKYNVKPQQIFTITTDNGGNVLKMTRDLSAKAIALENITSLVAESQSCDQDIENYLANVDPLHELFNQTESDDEDDNDNESNFDDMQQTIHENLLQLILQNVQNRDEYSFIGGISGIHCAAHTLQLAINSGIKNLGKPIQNVVQICRRVAKFMRLKSTAHALNSAGIPFTIPHLDVETRWCSTFIMVNILHNYLL